jgi:hypothetical protein
MYLRYSYVHVYVLEYMYHSYVLVHVYVRVHVYSLESFIIVLAWPCNFPIFLVFGVSHIRQQPARSNAKQIRPPRRASCCTSNTHPAPLFPRVVMDVAFDPDEVPAAAAAVAAPKRKIPDEVQQLFRCRQTVYAMLRKRGYVAPPTPDVLNAAKFVEKYGIHVERSQLLMSVKHAADPTKTLHVVRGSLVWSCARLSSETSCEWFGIN